MTNSDKIIKEVAEKLNLPQTVVRQAVGSQLLLVRYTIQNKIDRSVYIRKLGHFLPENIRAELMEQKVAAWKNKDRSITEEEDDPLRFD